MPHRHGVARLKSMKSTTSGPAAGSGFIFFCVQAAILAAAGELGLSRNGDPRTLWPGLVMFVGASISFWFAVRLGNGQKTVRLSVRPALEWVFAGAILLAAAFLRTWRITELPPGLFIDQGYQAYSALRALHEHFRPFYDSCTFWQMPAQTFYTLAGWFAFFGPSEVSSRLYFVFVALAAMPFIYWVFRQLAGPRAALIALFVLAVMRWHLNFSRNSFLAIQMPLFMFSTLAFFLYGFRTARRWPWVVAGVCLAAGMYQYYSYYVFPLLTAVYGAYEYLHDRKKFRSRALSMGIFALVAFAGAMPLFRYWMVQGTISQRYDQVSIFHNQGFRASLSGLAKNAASTALMFNRRGDDNPRHNWVGAPQLEPVGGALFALGFLYALSRWRQREYFYALSGLGIMCLPGLIGTEAPHAYRTLGAVPFAAFLCAVPLAVFWDQMEEWDWKSARRTALAVLAVALSLMTWNNLQQYFILHPRDKTMWNAYDPVPTAIGRRIAADGDRYDHYVAPSIVNHCTIAFLGYFHKAERRNLDIPECLAHLQTSQGRGAEYDIDFRKQGIRDLLKSLYPNGQEEILRDWDGKPYLTFFSVPPNLADSTRGLKAVFHPSGRETTLSRFPDDLPAGPWTGDFQGCVFADREGWWAFDVQSDGDLDAWIAGKRLIRGKKLKLARGFYSMRLHWTVRPGPAKIHLSARKPGGSRQTLDASCLTTLPLNRGLQAVYGTASSQEHLSYARDFRTQVQWEPVLDYESNFDLLVQHNWGAVSWKGRLLAPVTGDYRFQLQSKSLFRFNLDGAPPKSEAAINTWFAHLTAGAHTVRIQADKFEGEQGIVFSWKRPGDHDFQVIPITAFGETETGY